MDVDEEGKIRELDWRFFEERSLSCLLFFFSFHSLSMEPVDKD